MTRNTGFDTSLTPTVGRTVIVHKSAMFLLLLVCFSTCQFERYIAHSTSHILVLPPPAHGLKRPISGMDVVPKVESADAALTVTQLHRPAIRSINPENNHALRYRFWVPSKSKQYSLPASPSGSKIPELWINLEFGKLEASRTGEALTALQQNLKDANSTLTAPLAIALT